MEWCFIDWIGIGIMLLLIGMVAIILKLIKHQSILEEIKNNTKDLNLKLVIVETRLDERGRKAEMKEGPQKIAYTGAKRGPKPKNKKTPD